MKQLYYLALHLANKLSARKKRALLEEYSVEELFSQPQARSVLPRTSDLYTNPEGLLRKAEAESYKASSAGVHITHVHEQEYPENLLDVGDAPIALYYQGTLQSLDVNCVAIVGSRGASTHALNLSYQTSRVLSEQGVSVVSGLAKGVDGEAHKAALECGGRTLAVLGCGIDRVFPREHCALQKRIAEEGCVLSEFPFGAPPRVFHFPQRNRIISGLSCAVVVVECGLHSGALYTARFALQQGRELYVYPGRAGERSAGNALLQGEGVHLVSTPEDLLEQLSDIIHFKQPPPSRTQPNPHTYQKVSSDVLNTMGGHERVLYTCLSKDALKTIDQLVRETALPTPTVMHTLSSLILKGFCNQFGNTYTRNKLYNTEDIHETNAFNS